MQLDDDSDVPDTSRKRLAQGVRHCVPIRLFLDSWQPRGSQRGGCMWLRYLSATRTLPSPTYKKTVVTDTLVFSPPRKHLPHRKHLHLNPPFFTITTSAHTQLCLRYVRMTFTLAVRAALNQCTLEQIDIELAALLNSMSFEPSFTVSLRA